MARSALTLRASSGTSRACMASSTFCCTVSHGSRANNWKTMATPGFAPFSGLPRQATEPAEGAIRPAMQRSRVDLPDPDLPSSATISPSCG